ncbi:hypothetical protein MBRU_16435 [Mycolicibacterium brumae DSM 44177]|nr:hypothetical protein MBRU_16435 [Mycolicibacterium brumae DSM 44177]
MCFRVNPTAAAGELGEFHSIEEQSPRGWELDYRPDEMCIQQLTLVGE